MCDYVRFLLGFCPEYLTSHNRDDIIRYSYANLQYSKANISKNDISYLLSRFDRILSQQNNSLIIVEKNRTFGVSKLHNGLDRVSNVNCSLNGLFEIFKEHYCSTSNVRF